MPTRRVIRKVPRRAAELDEQLWPINGTLVILAGCIAGLIAAVGDFDSPIWYRNAWTHLLGLAASVAGLMVGTVYVSTRRGARRMQLAVLLALGLHLWLAVVLYVVPVYLDTGRRRPSAWVDETPKITFPDYGRAAHEQVVDPELVRPEQEHRPEALPQTQPQRTVQTVQRARPVPRQQEPVPATGSVSQVQVKRATPSASRQSPQRSGRRIRRSELAVREPRPRLQAQLAQGQAAPESPALQARANVQVRKQAVGPSQQVQTAMTRSPVPQPALRPQAVRRSARQEPVPQLTPTRRLAARTTVSPAPQAAAARVPAVAQAAVPQPAVRPQATAATRTSPRQARMAAVPLPRQAPSLQSPQPQPAAVARRSAGAATPRLQNQRNPALNRRATQSVASSPQAQQVATASPSQASTPLAVSPQRSQAPQRLARRPAESVTAGAAAVQAAVPSPTASGGPNATAARRTSGPRTPRAPSWRTGRVALQRAQATGAGSLAQAQAAALPPQGSAGSGQASPAAQAAVAAAGTQARRTARSVPASVAATAQGTGGAPGAAAQSLGTAAVSGRRIQRGRTPAVGSAGGHLARLGRQSAAGQVAPQSQAALAALATGPAAQQAASLAGSGAPATGARRQATSSAGGAAAQLAAGAGSGGVPQAGPAGTAAGRRAEPTGQRGPQVGSRSGVALARSRTAGGNPTGPAALLADVPAAGSGSGSAGPAAAQTSGPSGSASPGRLARQASGLGTATGGAHAAAPGAATGQLGGTVARRSGRDSDSGTATGGARRGVRLARATAAAGEGLPGVEAAPLAGPALAGSAEAEAPGPSGAQPGSSLTRRTTPGAGVPGVVATAGPEPSAAVTPAVASGSGRGGSRREARPQLAGGSRRGTTLARSTGTGYVTAEIDAEELGPVPQELAQQVAQGSPQSEAAGMRRQRQDRLAVEVVAREGPGGVALDRPGELGLPLERARVDASRVATTSHRFRLERAPLAGVELAPEVEAIAAPAFQDRDPQRRQQVARSRGGSPQTEKAVEMGLAFLARHQMPDGRWSLHRFAQGKGYQGPVGIGRMESDTAATGLALLAFLGAGYTHQQGKYRQEVAAGLKWLVDHQKPNGDLFTGGSRYAWLYSHGIAAIALCEAYGMTQDPQLRAPAQRAVDFIVAAQHPTLGGWRYAPGVGTDTSVSGWQLMALKSAEMAGLSVPQEVYSRLRTWLARAQWPEDQALYVYRPRARYQHQRTPSRAMTAEALLMQLYLGTSPQSPMIQQGARYLARNLPSFGSPRRLLRDAYYWYYATQVMFHAGGEHWDRWNRRQRALLVGSQVQEGPLAGSWDPLGRLPDRWGAEGGRIYVTALHLLILEVYYRHLPLYRPQVISTEE